MPPLALATLLLAAAPPDESITVENTRLRADQVRISAGTYAKAGLPPFPDFGQFARWKGPPCINVLGIPDPALAARVAARIAAAASAAGLAAAKPGCKPNLTVAFTDDARGLVAKVKSRKRAALPAFDPRLFAALDSATLPVRWWHVLGPAGAGGGAATPDAGALASSNVGTTLPAGPDAVGTSSWSSSLVDTNLSVWARAGVAVVDVGLATGVSLDALADYIALVMIAPMRLPVRDPGVPSVLTLFQPGSTATGLTSWDRAFIKGLYRIQMNRSAQRQRQQLLSAMTAELVPDAAPDQL